MPTTTTTERLFIGPRMHGIDEGTTLGVWTSPTTGSRFWRRTIGDATYDFSLYADGYVTVARFGPRLDREVVHAFLIAGPAA